MTTDVEPLAGDEPEKEIVPGDESLAPIRTLDRERTFRLRDAALALVVAVAAYIAMLLLLGYLPLPDAVLARADWGVAAVEALAAGIVLALAWRRGLRLRELFLNARPWYVEAFLGVTTAFVVWIGFELAATAGFRPIDPAIEDMAASDLIQRWEFLIVAAIFAPLGEELLFRGAIQSSLYPRCGAFMACLFQAMLFGAIHQRGWEIVVSTGVIGLCFGGLALWRASLLAPIVAHGTWNGVSSAWLIAAYYLSAHVPAATMDDAQRQPHWVHEPMTFGIALEHSAYSQYLTAEEWYGLHGCMLPKDEIKAMLLVRERFPKDEEYGAWALLRIEQLYVENLHDPRRAIVTGEEILNLDAVKPEIQASALAGLAMAYSELGEPAKAERAIATLEQKHADLEWVDAHAAELREWIRFKSENGE